MSDVRKMTVNARPRAVLSGRLPRWTTEPGLTTDDGAGIRSSLTTLNTISDRLTTSYGTMAGRIVSIETQRAVTEDPSYV